MKNKMVIFAIIGLLLSVWVFLTGVSDHMKQDAKVKAQIAAHEQAVAEIQKQMAAKDAQTQQLLQSLQQAQDALRKSPQTAAPTIIRETLPTQQPIIVNPEALKKDSLPDAPAATLTREQIIELANDGLMCAKCKAESDDLHTKVAGQTRELGEKDEMIKELKQEAKGGSIMHRTWQVVKWGSIFAGVGYVVGRSQRK